MKNIKLIFVVLISLILFYSCSSNDDLDGNSTINNDIIIGKWKTHKIFESNIEIEVEFCNSFWVTEYNTSKSVSGFNSENYPNSCPVTTSEFGWNWVNKGNGNYEIRYMEEEGTTYKFYKEGEKLVREFPDGIKKIIYNPYN